MTDEELKLLQDLVDKAAGLGIVYNSFSGTPITKDNLNLATNHPKHQELRKAGMNPVIEQLPDGRYIIRLKGKINWINHDGSITVLEEHCTFGTLEQLEDQIQWYLDNKEKYTNFIDKD